MVDVHIIWGKSVIDGHLTVNYRGKKVLWNRPPGIDPVKILQRKIYATLFFKHSDWLKNVSSQSKCLKK